MNKQRDHRDDTIEELEAENARLRAELAALSPPQPVAGWRERCVVVKRRCCGYDITLDGYYYNPGIEYRKWLKPMHEPTCGMYGDPTIARSALVACVVPPPGVQA